MWMLVFITRGQCSLPSITFLYVSSPSDPHVVQELAPYREEVESLAEKEVGKTMVFLNGSRFSCRFGECNLGSFIADAYVNLVLTVYTFLNSLLHLRNIHLFCNHLICQFTKFAGPGQWSKVGIALLNSGAIRSSIDERVRNGNFIYFTLRRANLSRFNSPIKHYKTIPTV